MGIKFRKKIKIAPGISLNLGTKGVSSVSVGAPGATLNVGSKRGAKVTVSAPGTGLSYTQSIDTSGKARPGLVILASIIVVGLIAYSLW